MALLLYRNLLYTVIMVSSVCLSVCVCEPLNVHVLVISRTLACNFPDGVARRIVRSHLGPVLIAARGSARAAQTEYSA